MMHTLFPTIIHEILIDQYETRQNDLVQFVLEEQKKDPIGVDKSNIGGWQSTWRDPTDDILTTMIAETVSNYFNKNSIYNDLVLRLHGWWMNINPTGASNNMHNHPGCDLAGVFWIKTPKDCGNINFHHPQNVSEFRSLMKYEPEFAERNSSYNHWWIKPTEGTLLIFPSHLYHWVDSNESNDDRISVSFNLELD